MDHYDGLAKRNEIHEIVKAEIGLKKNSWFQNAVKSFI